MMRWDIINHLIKKNNYKSYLEIGYYKGWSFDNVICKSKTAVDPNPCKTSEQEQAPYGAVLVGSFSGYEYIHKLPSDKYFEKFHTTYDLIFIDGLHEADQVFRDIENALKHLNSGGMIVLHDCNPPLYEHTTTGINGCWTGDTYKAIMEFRGNYNAEYVTVDTDWGVGIIDTRKIKPIKHLTAFPINTSWEIFSEHKEQFLNLISPEEFVERF